MPTRFEWLVPGRVVAGHVTDPLTAEEAVAMAQEIVHYLDSGTDHIHLVVEVGLRRRTIDLTTGRDAVYPILSHPNLGWIVLYGMQHDIIRALTDTLLRALRRSFRIVSSWDEAVTFLQKTDSTLPTLSNLPPIS